MKKLLFFTLLLFSISLVSAQRRGKMVRVKTSNINWWGYKVVKSKATTHYGSVKLKMGKFIFQGKDLVGGEFMIDMRTITDTDLVGKDNEELVDELKSSNFFDVRKNPVAKFKMKKILPMKSDEYNSEIIGDITIKGIRKTISFPANVRKNGYDVEIHSAKFPINRQDFDVFYRSSLKDYLIKDEMDLQFDLSTQ